jgi:hypothetical protein
MTINRKDFKYVSIFQESGVCNISLSPHSDKCSSQLQNCCVLFLTTQPGISFNTANGREEKEIV